MVRLMLFALLLVAALVVTLTVLAVLRTTRPAPGPQKPAPHDSNAQWARYYQDMATHARSTGDEGSAAEYDSLAKMYAGLPSEEP